MAPLSAWAANPAKRGTPIHAVLLDTVVDPNILRCTYAYLRITGEHMHPPFSTRPPATVTVESATAPVYNPLLSLSLLTATPAPEGIDAWVI
jgi:hypothetical protein